MGSFADYAENKILDHVTGVATFTTPSNLYVGLSTTTITDAGGNITEPSGNNYSRLTVAAGSTNWNTAASGSTSNKVDFTFATPSGSWGTVTDFFLSDASSGGNIVGYGVLGASQTIASGNVVKFAAGALTITQG